MSASPRKLARAAAIAAQNDAFRTGGWASRNGRVLMTRGIAALPETAVVAILHRVRTFTAFSPANDPYGEHDFGTIDHEGERVIWKIDYYADAELTFGAEDPRQSYRVLTIMRAEEY